MTSKPKIFWAQTGEIFQFDFMMGCGEKQGQANSGLGSVREKTHPVISSMEKLCFMFRAIKTIIYIQALCISCV